MDGSIYVIIRKISPMLRWILIYFINLQKINQKNMPGHSIDQPSSEFIPTFTKKIFKKVAKLFYYKNSLIFG